MNSENLAADKFALSQKINLQYIISAFFVVFFTWFFHEFAHWMAGWMLGYDPIMTINSTSVNSVENPPLSHQIIVIGAGPIVTIGIALIAFFFLLKKQWNNSLYLILFSAFYMRFLASAMNVINPNDEGKISSIAGLGTFTIPVIVTLFLFYLLYIISKKYDLSSRFNLSTTLLVMLFSSLLIVLDMFMKIRILG